jgi:hypothetical protein
MYYLHLIELATNRHAITIDETPKPKPTYTYLNDAPVVYADGSRVPNKIKWTLGGIVSDNETRLLALDLAKFYGCDILRDGKLLGLPQMGEPGKWVSPSEAAAALGKIGGSATSAAKKKSSAKNGRKGGRPRKPHAKK